MARNFVASSSQDIRVSASPTTAIDNVTFCMWYKPSSFATTQDPMHNGESDGGGGNGYGFRITTGQKAQVDIAFVANVQSSTSLSTGTWYHLIGERASGTFSLYLDGTSEGTPSTSNPNSVSGNYSIGSRWSSGSGSSLFVNGDIAEVAIWDRALSAAERLALAAGYSPLFFPVSLKAYHDLIGRKSPEISRVSFNALTVNNAPLASTHPRIIYPTSGY